LTILNIIIHGDSLKIIIEVIDRVISIIIFCFYLFLFIFFSFIINEIDYNSKNTVSILRLNPTCCKDIKNKGIMNHLYQLNYDAYFFKYYEAHIFCDKTKKFILKNNITVIEFGKNRYKLLNRLGFKFTDHILNEIKTTFELKELAIKQNIDIILSQEPYFNGIRALIIRAITKKPYIENVICDYDLSFKSTGKPAYPKLKYRKIEKIIERIVFKNADLVFGGNDHLTEYAIRNGANKNRTFTVRDIGIGEKHFLPLNERKNIKEELNLVSKKAILYCGRLHKEKYVEDVIRAFEIVSKEVPDSVLLLAGDGEQREYLEEIIKSLNLKNVIFLGFKPQEYIFNLMYSVDLIVSPLTGSSLVEAALSSTPIVAYDVEWHSELIKDGKTGRLVKFRDYEEMANAMIEILNNPGLNYGENARKLAIEMFSLEKTLEQRKMLIDKLLSGEFN